MKKYYGSPKWDRCMFRRCRNHGSFRYIIHIQKILVSNERSLQRHTTEECEYLIVVNVTTGERIKVLLNGTKVDQGSGITELINSVSGI